MPFYTGKQPFTGFHFLLQHLLKIPQFFTVERHLGARVVKTAKQEFFHSADPQDVGSVVGSAVAHFYHMLKKCVGLIVLQVTQHLFQVFPVVVDLFGFLQVHPRPE